MSLFKELKRRNVIRVATAYLIVGWLLIQVLGLATDSFEAPSWIMKLAITIIVIGFFISLIISWAYELTPEGIKRDKDVNRDDTITHHTAKKLDIITIVALIAVGSLVLWQQFIKTEVKVTNISTTISTEPETTPKEQGVSANSIAVLPFADLSKEGDQEYFSDGIAEEILNVLVRVDALQVTSRTSAFQFKGSNKGIPAIAEELKVRHVLEGSVRKSGETIRITAQLIDAQNDKHLWSEAFDRPLTTDNIFDIQDEISNAIVNALKDELKLNIIEPLVIKKTTSNLTAYELYLRAVPLFFNRKDLDIADSYLDEALELDQNFAKAWELRAALQHIKIDYNYSDMSIKEAQILTKSFALKAIELESQSALAMAALANNQYNEDGETDYHKVFELFDKAIDIDPNSVTSTAWRGWYYAAVGKLDLSLKDFRQCLELEPLYSMCYSNWTNITGQVMDYKSFEALLINGLNKDLISLKFIDLSTLAANKQELLFKVVANQKGNLEGWRKIDRLYDAYLNPEKNHRELIDDIKAFAKNKSSISALDLSRILMPIGAFELSPEEISMWGVAYKTYRKSPEFKNYIIDYGIYKYWLVKGFPPQCIPIGEDDFECD